MNTRRLFLYHDLPVAVILMPLVWYAIVGSDWLLKGEGGIIENMTVFFLVVAIGFCISSLSLAKRLGQPGLLKAWLFILILGATYFALEEISYGQHLFGWGTAESWKELNDQDETNLHNVHALFDQVPRNLLMLGILVGGVILPLYRHFRSIELDESSRFYWQWPTIDCVTIGLLVILIRPVLTVFETEAINTGEMKENLFALFILLYSLSIHARLKQKVLAAHSDTQSTRP